MSVLAGFVVGSLGWVLNQFFHPDACVAQTAKGSRSKLDTVPPGHVDPPNSVLNMRIKFRNQKSLKIYPMAKKQA